MDEKNPEDTFSKVVDLFVRSETFVLQINEER